MKIWIFVKLSLGELCDAKFSGLHPFDKMAIIHWVKNSAKTERNGVGSWDTNPWSNFCNPHWELISSNKWDLGTPEISATLEIAVGTHFHVGNVTKATPTFLLADGETSRLLLPSSAS